MQRLARALGAHLVIGLEMDGDETNSSRELVAVP